DDWRRIEETALGGGQAYAQEETHAPNQELKVLWTVGRRMRYQMRLWQSEDSGRVRQLICLLIEDIAVMLGRCKDPSIVYRFAARYVCDALFDPRQRGDRHRCTLHVQRLRQIAELST